MADTNADKGFSIPAPQAGSVTQGATTVAAPAQIQIEMPVALAQQGPQPRDYAVAGGVLVVLLIAFFFAKNAYSNHLAGKRIPPGAANAAGWWLFIFLSGLATASVLAITSPMKFLTPFFMAPLGGISVVALVLMLLSGRRS
ncbi:MAG TPA: hypothetical protein VFF81_03055 [Noviherbaspirillum sp.]|nr:hypothetical protein [Noviherbaspirillum sp.]